MPYLIQGYLIPNLSPFSASQKMPGQILESITLHSSQPPGDGGGKVGSGEAADLKIRFV